MYVHLYIYLNSLLVLTCVDISRKFWKKIHKKARQKDQICLKNITDVSSFWGGGGGGGGCRFQGRNYVIW